VFLVQLPHRRGSLVSGRWPTTLRGSAFGLLATTQAGANLAASAIAGILWTAISPAAAFGFLAPPWPSPSRSSWPADAPGTPLPGD